MATETTTPQELEHKVEPQEQHRWLQKLVGDWTVEFEASMGPGQPTFTHTGSERVRAFGDLWIIAEGEGAMPDGTQMQSVMTLGYDPQKQRFVGTWIGTPMANLWVYEGELDPSKRTLSLYSEGPSMAGEGTARYKESIEFESDDHRIFRSQMEGEGGKWQEPLMTAQYRRRR